jgi:hypothetical protein
MSDPIISPENPQLKRCTKCGEIKPDTAEYFHRSKHSRNGLKRYCKVCASRANYEYKTRTRGPRRGGPPRVEDANPLATRPCTKCRRELPLTLEFFGQDRGKLTSRCNDCLNEARRQYRKDHIEQERARSRDWTSKNPEERKTLKREWARAHRDETRAAEKKWRQENPDKVRAASSRRRNQLANVGGSFTAADIEAIRVAQGNRCYICHKPLKKYHIDHFIPLALGGSNDPGNLRLACPKCNMSKSAKHPHDIGLLI